MKHLSLFFAAASVGIGVVAPPPPPVGACCVADEECKLTESKEVCESYHKGYFAGAGTMCEETVGGSLPICLVGSCCVGTELECEEELYATQCAGVGPLPSFVPGGKCKDDVTCSFGACCRNGTCRLEVYGGSKCEADGGVFLGKDTECLNPDESPIKDICELERPCNQECNYDPQCDSGCCFTKEQLKFKKPNVTLPDPDPVNDPKCPILQPSQGEPTCPSDIECFYDWDCCCGECFYLIKCNCTANESWSCFDPPIPSCICPAPVGQCTESEWCECADQVQEQDGGDFRNFVRCVDECPIKKSKKRSHRVL